MAFIPPFGGFLSLSITDPRQLSVLGGGGACLHHRMFGSLPALYPVDARSTPCPSYDNPKGPWMMPGVPWKANRLPAEKHWSKGEMGIRQRMTGAAGKTHLDRMDGCEERHMVFSKHIRGGSDSGFDNNCPEEATSA